MGGMSTLLVYYLGFEIPNDCVVLDTNATTICYDKSTLRRIRFLQHTDHRNDSLVIPNGRAVLFPRHLFDVRAEDTVESLCATTHNYSLQRPVDPTPIAAGVPINLEEEESNKEEEEEEEEDVPQLPLRNMRTKLQFRLESLRPAVLCYGEPR